MRGLVFATLAALVACTFGGPSVVRFAVNPQEPQKVQLKGFQFTNCLPKDNETGVVNSLSFLPDPLVFPGPLDVAFSVTTKAKIDTPLKAVSYMGKKVGSIWVKVPCIGYIGSCTYEDVCQLLNLIPQCPDSFTENNIPCQCPFKAGDYNLPTASFQVDADVFPPGDYHLQANLTMGTTVVGCYDILATFG